MEKSNVTEFFLKYFEEKRINISWISEKTGIKKEKLEKGYGEPLTAEEFLRLCALLAIEPEEIMPFLKG